MKLISNLFIYIDPAVLYKLSQYNDFKPKKKNMYNLNMYRRENSDVHEVSSEKLCSLILLHDMPAALN